MNPAPAFAAISASAVAAALDYPNLIDRLRQAFRAGAHAPIRQQYALGNGHSGRLLLMPAWRPGGPIGVKVVTVMPGNRDRNLPTVQASYLLLDGATGALRALIDGDELTRRRTAAASALAAGFLARDDARRFLMVGAGALAAHLVRAHAVVRPIRDVAVWNRTAARARTLAVELSQAGLAARAVDDLAAAVNAADIVCCATTSALPLIQGEWLRPGQHLDLVGGFTPAMREADDAAIGRARLYVDSRAGGLAEAGDIVDPLRRGLICEDDVVGDLFDLCRGECAGRGSPDEITLFKSVGHALEDLAAAELVAEKAAP
jgi:alanine dehydrogenase